MTEKDYSPIIKGADIGSGWQPLLLPILQRINELNEGNYDIKITTIKEKWGRLYVYVDGGPEDLFDLILEMEEKSAHICQDCGAPAETVLSTHGWYYTLCAKCLAIRGIKVVKPSGDGNS